MAGRELLPQLMRPLAQLPGLAAVKAALVARVAGLAGLGQVVHVLRADLELHAGREHIAAAAAFGTPWTLHSLILVIAESGGRGQRWRRYRQERSGGGCGGRGGGGSHVVVVTLRLGIALLPQQHGQVNGLVAVRLGASDVVFAPAGDLRE